MITANDLLTLLAVFSTMAAVLAFGGLLIYWNIEREMEDHNGQSIVPR
jgi:hypothetical protein